MPITLRSINKLQKNTRENIVFQGFNKYKDEYNYLYINANPNDDIHFKFDKILFINRCKKNEFIKLKSGDSYRELLLNLKYEKSLDAEITQISEFVNNIHCYHLLYKDMEYVNRVIENKLL